MNIYVHGMFTYVETSKIKVLSTFETIPNVMHAKKYQIVEVSTNNPSILAYRLKVTIK
jgi:hypothetical protein